MKGPPWRWEHFHNYVLIKILFRFSFFLNFIIFIENSRQQILEQVIIQIKKFLNSIILSSSRIWDPILMIYQDNQELTVSV